MTVAAELAKGGQRMEFILCIEGVGWPDDENTLSSGFGGTLFVTDDLDGDLATQLTGTAAPTIRHGLQINSPITDSLESTTGRVTYGSLSFNIIDTGGYLLANFTPKNDGNETTISTALAYNATSVVLADGTAFATGDVVWVGDQECIKLGTKGGGGPHTYTTSTRAYLGTDRGRRNHPSPNATAYAWHTTTKVRDTHRRWRDRKVDLYMHVPGESSGNCLRIWSGNLRAATADLEGTTWSMSAAGEPLRHTCQTWRPIDGTTLYNFFSSPVKRDVRLTDRSPNPDFTFPEAGYVRVLTVVPLPSQNANFSMRRWIEYGHYMVAQAYRYRAEPGGTYGMMSTWDADSVQALDTSSRDAVLGNFIRVGDQVFRCRGMYIGPGETKSTANRWEIECEIWSSAGVNSGISVEREEVAAVPPMTPCRFLLDNWSESYEINRYAVNKQVSRNPITTALCHMMSRDDEYFVADAIAGGTTTTVNFTASTVGAANMWTGAALFCVEGDNKGESRVIASNTTGAVTVEDAFSTANHNGNEYQIRNSIYDVLPFGWGLGIPWHRVDIDSFESVRDDYLAEATLGKFILGTEDEMDLLEMLRRHIFEPYGVVLRMDRSSGKVEAKYMRAPIGDGVVDDYVAIADSDIIDFGDVDYRIGDGIANVVISTRKTETKVVSVSKGEDARVLYTASRVGIQGRVSEAVRDDVPALIGGETIKVEIEPDDFSAMMNNEGGKVQWEAVFNHQRNIDFLVNRARQVIDEQSVRAPTIDLVLHPTFITQIELGDFVSLSWASAPISPFAAARGWSSLVCRVIGTQIPLGDDLGYRITVEMLVDRTGGKIAPACDLDGAFTGSDVTSDWFIVAPTSFVADASSDKDYYGFAVGDLIDVHDEDGSIAAGPYTIRSFGLNDSSTPQGASDDTIRIDEAAPALGAGPYYVTLDAWSASNTARMETYAALATSGGALTGGDNARTYG